MDTSPNQRRMVNVQEDLSRRLPSIYGVLKVENNSLYNSWKYLYVFTAKSIKTGP